MTDSDSKSLVHVTLAGDLSKPATVLIEKISEAMGGIFRPYQITRVAKAEAKADIVRASAQIEITARQRRAVERFLAEEAKKQNNIEAITSKALPELSGQAQPDKVEDDWIANFFDKCRLISDEEMQTLWAKVLAGEANSPGKFSKKTVNILAQLDKSDAVMFGNVCSFCIELGRFFPLVYDHNAAIYKDHGVNFGMLSHLETIGLIRFDPAPMPGFVLEGFGPRCGNVPYFGSLIWIDLPPGNFIIGQVMFTQIGQQLAGICGGSAVDGFVDYLKAQWNRFGYKTEPETKLATEAPSS